MLTRSELVMRIEGKHPRWYARDITAAVDVILEHIGGSLALGQRVELRSFGTFFVRARRAQSGHAGVGRVAYAVPARGLVAFRAGRAMRRRLNPGATGSAYAWLGKNPGGERMKMGPKPKPTERK
jgi:integration host factor subunit beta